MKTAIFATYDEALTACQRIDAAVGYPKTEQDIGPPVLTERWAEPMELQDGTWAVAMLDEHRTAAKVTAAALKERTIVRKPIADVAVLEVVSEAK